MKQRGTELHTLLLGASQATAQVRELLNDAAQPGIEPGRGPRECRG